MMAQERTFAGPDHTSVTAYDASESPGSSTLNRTLLDLVLNAPASLTPAERLFIFNLTYAIRPLRYLEIGVLHGGSAMIVSGAMDSLDHHGRLFLVDPEPQIAPHHWEGVQHRSSLIRGFSPNVIPEAKGMAGGPFDLVFIDGDHSSKGVTRDAHGVIDHVLDGGYILFHDAFRPNIRRAIDQFVDSQRRSAVDFGMVTREYHISEPSRIEDGVLKPEKISCGLRLVQVRRKHGRVQVADRVRGVLQQTRRRLRTLRQR